MQRTTASLVSLQSDNDEDDDSFLLDSGASNHTCGNLDLFTSLEPTYALIGTAEKGRSSVVTQMGTIVWKSMVEGKPKTFSLSGVYYIPRFSNLISIG